MKEYIIEKYGSIDNFVEQTDVKISRTYLFKLVNDNTTNPSLAVLKELSRVLEIEIKDVIDLVYSNRHRD